MGGGRDQDGDQDGTTSVIVVLTGRKGSSVCGGARTTSSNRTVGGGRRATSSYGEAAFRSMVVGFGNRHSMMSRTRCFGGRGSAPLKQEAEAHAVYLLPPALNRAKAQHACVLRPPERGGAGCQFLIKTPMTSTPSSTCLG